MAEDLTDQIATNAAEPKSGSTDGVSFTQHSLPDQIAADRYLKEQTATGKKKIAIRLIQIRPGGGV